MRTFKLIVDKFTKENDRLYYLESLKKAVSMKDIDEFMKSTFVNLPDDKKRRYKLRIDLSVSDIEDILLSYEDFLKQKEIKKYML
jgi:hypothetical protein